MTKYFKSLQILRALAFLSIFFFHMTVLGDAFSRWSITVFLMLSGFLNVFHGYEQNTSCNLKVSLKYAFRKIKGIYPLHLIMLVIAMILYFYSNRPQLVCNSFLELAKVFTNVLLISDWGPKRGWWLNVFSEYNIVTWYLSLSLLLFLLSPLFMQAMHKLYDSDKKSNYYPRPIIVAVILYCITIGINYAAIQILTPFEASIFIYESPLSRAGDYLIAMQIGYIYLKSNQNKDNVAKNNPKIIAIVGIISGLASVLFLYIGDTCMTDRHSLIVSSGFYYTLPTIILIYSLAKCEDSIIQILSNTRIINYVVRVIIYVASISQYAYLIHVPVINGIHGVYKRIGNVDLMVWSVTSFAITIGASMMVDTYKKKKQKQDKHLDL